MKKIFLSILFFLFIFVSKQSVVDAACILNPPGSPPCTNLSGSCNNLGSSYCCGSPNECSLLIGNVSTPSTGCGKTQINSAIGCIPVENTTEFMGWILGWALGIGGGISFLLIVYASFMIMTSAGAPERLKAGQELLTSAISGLIMLIFSVTILKIIGIDILKLDTF